MEEVNHEHGLEGNLRFGCMDVGCGKPPWEENRTRSCGESRVWGYSISRMRLEKRAHVWQFRKRTRGKMRPGWEV